LKKKRSPLKSAARKTILMYSSLGVLLIAALIVAALALRPAPVAAGTIPAPAFTSTPKVPRVIVIGDSYTGTTKMGGAGDKQWTKIVQANLFAANKQRSDWDVTTLGGSGYISKGTSGKNFALGIEENINAGADIAILFGSRNDVSLGEDEVAAAAPKAINRLKERNPKAKLIVIGPTWGGGNVPLELEAMRDSIKSAATAAGATFIDPLELGWFLGPDSKYIGADGVHPTDEGNAYLAEKLTPVLAAAFPPAK
jgi:lysophospholipase L1-like esterase